jgi:DNA-binding SARP family transcriptional activator/DNA polymerase III delta prime subunit
MDFHILGPIEAIEGDRPLALGGAKQRALLGMLLLHANEVVSSDRLIDELWAGERREEAARTLQVAVSRLRKALEPGRATGTESVVVVTRAPGYELRTDPQRLDVKRFEALVSEGRRALVAGDARSARAKLDGALCLWRGPPLADLAYESFCQAEIARLEELRLGALEERIEADLALGRHTELVGELRALVREEPLRERLRAQLMLALYRSGRQAEALDAYADARATLVEELGIEPGRQLRALHQTLLQQDPSLDHVTPTEPPSHDDEAQGVEPRGVGVFVGRERELEELLASLEDTFAGRGRLILVGGEPGIGKTRLAGELASHAAGRGARVLSGRCWEAGGAPAYWPWVQPLRAYLRASDPEAVRAQLGRGAPDIAQMLPEVRELVPDLAPPPSLESEGARFRLFDATASFLRNAARAKPLVLVLDDLHAADTPSLLLLQFLAGELADAKVLIVGTYRDIELRPDHALVSTLAELQRHETTQRMPLEGLTKLDVSRFIELTAHLHPAEALAAAIHGQTEGNPFFVDEVVKLLVAEGRLEDVEDPSAARATIPPSVREVIARRLRRLSKECTDVLTVAAVLGREFALDALARMSELKGDQLLEALDEAIAAHVVDQVSGAHARFRFSHGLIRDALYDGLAPGRRLRMHRMIGEALEAVYAQDPEPHLAELCHHFFEAAAVGDADKAIGYSRRAGDRAQASLAYEEAVRLYQMALEVLELKEPVDEATRCDLLLALGDTQMRAGDGAGAKETFWRAAEIARRAQMPDRLARAALGYGGRFVWSRAGSDQRLVPLLEEALAAVADGDRAVGSRLRARLSGALRDPPSRERAASLSQRAVEMARRLDDPATLAYALDARHVVIWGPDTVEERAAITAETARLAEEAGDEERAFQIHYWRVASFLEVGDLSAARDELAAAVRLAEELRQAAQRWYVAVIQAQLVLLEGRFAEAERLIEQALALGQQAQSWEALVYYRLQTFGLRSAQGRLEELEETIRESVDEYPGYRVFSCALASLLCDLGHEAECREIFEALAADDFAELPRDEEWLFGMTLLAPICAALRDTSRAAVMYELLSPYAHRNALGVPEVSTGSVSGSLGPLAATMGRWDEASRHFEEAIAMNTRMGAGPWLARTQHDYAGMLLRRDAPQDKEKAQQLLALALETYRELGMKSWADRASADQP